MKIHIVFPWCESVHPGPCWCKTECSETWDTVLSQDWIQEVWAQFSAPSLPQFSHSGNFSLQNKICELAEGHVLAAFACWFLVLAPLDFVILPSACSLSGHLLKFSFSLFSGIARGVEHHLAVQIVSWFFWTFHHQVIQVGSPPRAMECKKAMVTKPLCQHLPHSSVHHGCPKQKDQVLVTFSGICMIVLVRLIRNPHFDQVVQVTLDFQRFSEIFHQLLFRNIARLQHFASLAVSQILAIAPGAWKGKHASISSGLCRSLFRFGGSFAVVQGYAGLLLHIVWRSRRVRCRLGAGHGWTTGSAPTSNLHASLFDKEASEADLELGMAGQRGRHQHQIFMVMSLPNIVEQHLKHKVHHILRLLRKTHN